MRAQVFFYDSENIDTGEFISLQNALSEDYVRVVNNKIVPTDQCSIIIWYSLEYWNSHSIAEEIEIITNQMFMPYDLFYSMLLEIVANDTELPSVQYDP